MGNDYVTLSFYKKILQEHVELAFVTRKDRAGKRENERRQRERNGETGGGGGGAL
jgi:hypothetical protein